MAQDIVGGLFGVDPQQLMQQRQATDAVNAYRFANLDPMQRAQMSIYQGSAGLGRGIGGLLGGDAEMEKASKIQQLAGQFDLSTPQGAREFGRALQPFAPTEAMKAMTKADAMEQSALGRQKTQLDITGTENKQAKQQRLEAEIAKLPENASDEQLLAVYRRFGNADQQAAILQRSLDAKEGRALKFDLAQEKAAAKAEGVAVQQKAMATDTLESSTEGRALVSNLTRDVSNLTVGLGGYASWVPMTSSKKFAADLDTLKSRLTLAAMNAAKAQSRTGATGFGALNSKELKVLQDNIVALDTGLSPEDFKKKLKEVDDYFIKLQNKATTTLGGTPSVTVSSANADNDPLGIRE